MRGTRRRSPATSWAARARCRPRTTRSATCRQRTASPVPPVSGERTRTSQRVLGTGLPSCGLVVNTTAAATPVSSTEDICSVGTDSGANPTSPQQVQLIRQCMSAALNLAATAHAPQPGDCNSVFPGITQMFNSCCTGPTSVCDSGASPGAIDASGCIGTLDRFNNLETTFDIGVGQGPAGRLPGVEEQRVPESGPRAGAIKSGSANGGPARPPFSGVGASHLGLDTVKEAEPPVAARSDPAVPGRSY